MLAPTESVIQTEWCLFIFCGGVWCVMVGVGNVRRQLVSLVLASLVLFACGDGPENSGYIGDYEVVGATLNEEGCDTEGPAIETTDLLGFFEKEVGGYLMVDACTLSFPGYNDSWLQFVSCDELSACHEDRCTSNSIHLGEEEFRDGGDESGWTNEGHSTVAWEDTDLCEGQYYTIIMIRTADGTLRIEKRSYEVEPFEQVASESFGGSLTCTTENAKANAKEACSSLEVLTAKAVDAASSE